MTRKISFKGKIPSGLQDQIRLSTNDGMIGYKITKFQCISDAPATTTAEIVCKIFTTDQTGSVGPDVDFNDTDLLAVYYLEEHSNSTDFGGSKIIFDNEIVNQDIFVTASDGSGGTKECNYYIELEVMKLDLSTSTYLTVKNIRSSTQT
jgi:hypothetical protein